MRKKAETQELRVEEPSDTGDAPAASSSESIESSDTSIVVCSNGKTYINMDIDPVDYEALNEGDFVTVIHFLKRYRSHKDTLILPDITSNLVNPHEVVHFLPNGSFLKIFFIHIKVFLD